MKNIFPKAALKQLSTYVAIIVIFIYNVVLDKNLDCSCERQALVCYLYLFLPVFILFVLQLWMDKKFQRAWKYTCAKNCKFFCVLLYHIIKAIFIGLLWVVSVLIEGDWFVCCYNDHSEKQKQLACKDEKDITLEEHTIIAKLKHTSWIIGISLLSCALFGAALMSSFAWMKCCKKKCDRKLTYYKVILDEEKKVLKEILTTAAKKKLTEEVEIKMHGEQWETCYDVATELIEKNTGPGAAGANQEQQREQQQPGQQPEQQQPEQQREQEQPGQQREPEQPGQQREQEQPEQQQPEQQQPEQKREQEQQPQKLCRSIHEELNEEGSDEEEEGPEEKGGVPERSSTKLQMQPLMQNKE